jgi:hypothetical protein
MPSIRWNLRPRWGEIGVDRHGRGATGGEGSGRGFEESVAVTYGRLVGLLFAFLHDRAQAEDMVQDAFAGGPGRALACDAGWTRIDLATGSRQPAFGGLAGVGELSLSADGHTLASLHTTAPATLNWAENGWSARPSWSSASWPAAASGCGRSRRAADRCGALALTSQGCGGGYDNLLVRYDLETRQVLSTTPLGLPIESLRAHGTRCLRRPRWRPRSSRSRRPCLPPPIRGSGSARRSGR